MTLQDFEKEVRSLSKVFGSELPFNKDVEESIRKSYELGLYSEDAYWRALEI